MRYTCVYECGWVLGRLGVSLFLHRVNAFTIVMHADALLHSRLFFHSCVCVCVFVASDTHFACESDVFFASHTGQKTWCGVSRAIIVCSILPGHIHLFQLHSLGSFVTGP